MNRFRKHRKEIFREPDLLPREEKIQQTIQISMNRLITAQEPMDPWEFIYCQSRYIKKRWWFLQALLLVLLYHHISTLHEAIMIRQSLGIGAPLFIILVIPELWRNQNSSAMDIEFATMYTLRQLYSARLTLLAGVDLLLLTVFCLSITTSQVLSFLELLTQFVLPANVTCCICLTCLYTPPGGESGLLSGTVSYLFRNLEGDRRKRRSVSGHHLSSLGRNVSTVAFLYGLLRHARSAQNA